MENEFKVLILSKKENIDKILCNFGCASKLKNNSFIYNIDAEKEDFYYGFYPSLSKKDFENYNAPLKNVYPICERDLPKDFYSGELIIITYNKLPEEGSIERGIKYFRDKNADAGVYCNYNYTGSLDNPCVDIGYRGNVVKYMSNYQLPDCSLEVVDFGAIYFKDAKDYFSTGIMTISFAINKLIQDKQKKVLPYFVNEV